MGRIGRLIHEAHKELKKNTRFNESKKEEKLRQKAELEKQGKRFYAPTGLFSRKTLDSYKKTSESFLRYTLKNHPKVKNLEDCRQYVPEFLEAKKEEGLSAYSLSAYGSALGSMYHCSKNDFDFEYPIRRREDIKRCRNATESYAALDEKYKTVELFFKATGCRRAELWKLRKEDFRPLKDGSLGVYKRGKGGLERLCRVNPKYADEVREYLKDAPTYRTPDGEDRLFKSNQLPKGAVHQFRADYARDLYEYYEAQGYSNGKTYHCKKELAGIEFDKGILKEVSYDLQHHRNNVVINYLWKGK